MAHKLRIALFALLLTAAMAWGAMKLLPTVVGEKITYTTVAVSKGNIVRAVTANGDLNPVRNVTVGCQISGTIAKLYADFNSEVKEGQLIAEIDPATYEANVASARGNLAVAHANLAIAKLNYDRTKELFERKVAAKSEWDKAGTDLQQAEANVQVQDASVKRAQVDLDRCKIFAPIDGIVISRAVEVGQTVAASLNAPILFTIANDLTKMQINAKVAEADVGGVAVDQEVTFNVDAFPQQPFRGRVVQVRNSPIIVDNVVNYDTIIEVSNPELKLKPGMTASVSIQLARRTDVLRVPNAALRFRPSPGIPVEGGNEPAPATPGAAPAASPGASPTPAVAAESPRAGGTRRGGGGGGGGPGPGEGGARGGRGGRPEGAMRTVYVAPESGETLKAVRVKVGITDGVFTEVLEGLNPGDQLATAVKTGLPSSAPAASTNVFAPQPPGPRR